MLAATFLALGAAVLHAAWNLAVKQSTGDRFLMLWGQFAIAAAISTPILLAFGGMPAKSWLWVGVSGSVHLPYCVFLAKAYDTGDFSFVYPLARGGGAMIAAIGGVVFLSDQLRPWTIVGIVTIGCGLAVLAGFHRSPAMVSALIVAITIGVYSVSDARGIRSSGTPLYALATHAGTCTSTTLYGLATGRVKEMRSTLRTHWRRLTVVAIAATATYGMVQLAFRQAPVGYVTALRESSVVLAAIVGWRTLGESAGRRRVFATLIVLAGLITMIVSR